LQLLGNLQATTLLFEHGDDAPEVAFGTLEALDNVGMGSVYAHGSASYPGGYKQASSDWI
jgi:hypothetical protein